MLHVTAARRALQQDRDVDDAVDALEDAERLGRQAMGDIHCTVGLLDDVSGSARRAPEPGVDDIPELVDDSGRAGLPVRLHIDGPADRVSAAAGLTLYRITQESLANIAKHAPDTEPVVTLHITRSDARLTVVNRLPVAAAPTASGRGLTGMRQRVELLDGAFEVGPDGDNWSVRAAIPLDDGGPIRLSWCNT